MRIVNRRTFIGAGSAVAAGTSMAIAAQANQTSTYTVPTDFGTLADALESLSSETSAAVIVIESGHSPQVGASVAGGDYSHIHIMAEDPVVIVHPDFVGPFIAGVHSRLPTLAALIDMDGRGDDGYHVNAASTGVIAADAGVRNAGGRGLYVNGSSMAYAVDAIFTGAANRNVWVSRGSSLDAERADLSNSGGYNAVYVSRGSTVHIEYADVTGAANNAVAGTRSWVDCSGVDVSGAGRYGILAERGAHVCADQATVQNCGKDGVRAEDGSFVNIKLGTVTGNADADIVIARGSTIHADSARTTHGAPNVADCSVPAFNSFDNEHGVIFAVDQPD